MQDSGNNSPAPGRWDRPVNHFCNIFFPRWISAPESSSQNVPYFFPETTCIYFCYTKDPKSKFCPRFEINLLKVFRKSWKWVEFVQNSQKCMISLVKYRFRRQGTACRLCRSHWCILVAIPSWFRLVSHFWRKIWPQKLIFSLIFIDFHSKTTPKALQNHSKSTPKDSDIPHNHQSISAVTGSDITRG